MLEHHENGLNSCIVGDISIALLIAKHTEFKVINMISDEFSKLIDFVISYKLIRFVLKAELALERIEVIFNLQMFRDD